MIIRTTVLCGLLFALAACETSQPAQSEPVYGSAGTITAADLAAVNNPGPTPEAEEEVYEGYLFEILWRETGASPPPLDPRYPVILGDTESQRRLGLLEVNYGPYRGGPELANKCYYYGDGGNLLSVSDEFLATYTARKFTLRSLCLGLISGVMYNPETGARLATVIMADLVELASPDYIGEPGAITEELPIELPACFARGLPLTDCTFAYHPFTGARLLPTDTTRIAEAGAKVLVTGRRILAAGHYDRPCNSDQIYREVEDQSCYTEYSDGLSGYYAREYRINPNHPVMVPFGGFVDFSPVHPNGFAYAIFADGAAGPSASMESVTLALNGKNRASSASLNALKIAAGGG